MAVMYMPALDGALEKIEDWRKVNFIRSTRNDKNKRFLIAGVSGGEDVQLTAPQSLLTYPFEPVLSFSSHLGDLYFRNFVYLNDDVSLNWHNLERINMVKNESGTKATISADFKDGSSEELFRVKAKRMAVVQQQIYKAMSNVRELVAEEADRKQQKEDHQM